MRKDRREDLWDQLEVRCGEDATVVLAHENETGGMDLEEDRKRKTCSSPTCFPCSYGLY